MNRNGALFKIAVIGAVLSIASVCLPSYSTAQGSPSGGTMSGPGVPSANFAMSGGSYGGTIGGGNSTASCTGPATWDFDWTGNDALPYQLVVKKSVTIQAQSWQFTSGGPGSVSVSGPTGLSTTTVTTPLFGPPGMVIGWFTSKTISGTVYEVVSGANEISVQVPMSASASSSSGSMSASAWSTVTLHPALINFGDSVAVGDEGPVAPIGGKVVASATVVGLSGSTSAYDWETPVGQPFDSFTVASDLSSSSLAVWVDNGSDTESFFFREARDDVKIGCQIELPSIGVSVMAQRDLIIDEPEQITLAENFIAGMLKVDNIDMFRLKLETQSGNQTIYTYGRGLKFYVQEAPSVILKGLQKSDIQIVQLVKPKFYHIWYDYINQVDFHYLAPSVGRGQWGLDHNYPYPYASGKVRRGSGSEEAWLRDSPGTDVDPGQFNEWFTQLEMDSEFKAFLMFKPTWTTGSMPVTLTVNDWDCHGKMSRPTRQSSWSVISPNVANKGNSVPTTAHPIWNLRHISGTN